MTENSDTPCLFCESTTRTKVLENAHAYAVWDQFPVTKHHLLIIPKRHTTDYFGLTQEEKTACDELLTEGRALIRNKDDTVAGFNIGMNCGKAAGQTIFHCHIHLIPRREGDVSEPRGGIRHTIPGKGNY